MLKKLLLSVLAIFGFTFLLSSNSYAVSDISVTYTSVPAQWSDVFPTCTGDCLSDYTFLVVEKSVPFYSTLSSFPQTFYIRFDGSNTNSFNVSFSSAYSVYELPFSGSPNNLLQWRSNLPSEIFDNGGFTLTLTNTIGTPASGTLNISTNGTYDVSGYATAVVDVSSELPPYSQIVVDSFWKYHVAIAGGLASIFAIFVVYRIIKSRLR